LLVGQICNICQAGKLQKGELTGWVYNLATRKTEPKKETARPLRQIKKNYQAIKENPTPKCLICHQKKVSRQGQNCFACQHNIYYQQWREKQKNKNNV
jgi:hypothetical protein